MRLRYARKRREAGGHGYDALSVDELGVGVIGVGLIGAYHAANLARRVEGARLVGVADPQGGLAEATAQRLGCSFWSRDYQELLKNPTVEAVVIASPAAFHPELIVAATQAGKAVFCEKPLANTLEDADRAIQAVHSATVAFQLGFQRRFDPAFAKARTMVQRGELGSIQLLRSITRDPSLDQPEKVTPWAIFLETLIHDFDVLRFLAGGAEPVEVYALADALILPDWKPRGMIDTAVVSLRYDSGAMATADASFQAVYGYDVRAEVFGSEGMASIGDSVGTSLVHHSRAGSSRSRPNWFIDVFDQAYVAELAYFARAVRGQVAADNTTADARAALVLALTAIRSVETGRPVRVSELTNSTG
jgi:myo-inositol 2-dehydrogenase / D-chiro-inositol 1-dehydrogenase